VNKELAHGESTPQLPDLGKLTVSKLADFVSIVFVIVAAAVYFLTR
jgi:hypothetical protein